MRWTILLLLWLSTVINYIDRQSLSVLLPTLRADLHLSSADYGLAVTLFMVAYTATQVGAGMLIDRIGARTGFAITVGLWSVAAMAHALVRGLTGLCVARFALGIGEAGNWPAGTKTVAEWFPKDRRAFAMGVFDGGSAVGAMLAPPLVAALTLWQGWRTSFIATGSFGFVWILAWLALRRGNEPFAASTSVPVLQHMRSLLGSRRLWGLMVTRMAATPVWWFYVLWLPDYLSKDRGFSLKEIGLFGWIPFLAVDLGKLFGGAASDHLLARGFSATVARKSVMAAAAIFMSAGLLVVGAKSAFGALAWVSLATAGFGMWSANILALHADMFPAESMASAVGLTGMAAGIGGAAFTYATGRIVDTLGYGPVFTAAALLAFAALLSLVFLLGRVEGARLYAVQE